MNEKIQLALFIGLFLALYAAMNYFVLTNIARYFGIRKTILFWVLLGVLTISYVLASMFESGYGNMWSKGVYFAAALWMGFMFITLCLILLQKILGFFVKTPLLTSGMMILGIAALVSLYGIINARVIAVDELDITSDRIHKEIRIVHIADMHIGPINGKGFLKNIVYMTNRLEPDYVMVTGDLLDGRYIYDKNDFSVLRNIHAKKYLTLGNHETYAGIDYSMHLIDGLGFVVLNNISVSDEDLQIIGISDAEDKQQVAKVLSEIKLSNKSYKVLMYHRPIGFRDANTTVDLMLSGHTHAGQIFPFTFLAWLENKYINGAYRQNGSTLHVSSGAGTWGPPMRIGSRSEIVLIRLHPAK